MAIVQTNNWKSLEKTLVNRTTSRTTDRPLDKNPLSKSNRILTHAIDPVNSAYVKRTKSYGNVAMHQWISKLRDNKRFWVAFLPFDIFICFYIIFIFEIQTKEWGAIFWSWVFFRFYFMKFWAIVSWYLVSLVLNLFYMLNVSSISLTSQ